MTVPKINPFNQAMAIQGINSGSTARIAGISGAAQAKNPFAGKENLGVGLVNSDLSNLSYALPNGKTSTCNTLGIA
jgi:hypothetical protein